MKIRIFTMFVFLLFSLAFASAALAQDKVVIFQGSQNGAEPSTDGAFTVRLLRGHNIVGGVTVTLEVLGSSTATAGVDYVALPTSINFPPNNDATTPIDFVLPVVVIDDSEIEGDETVNVLLTGADKGYAVDPANDEATVVIADNDVAPTTTTTTTTTAVPTTTTTAAPTTTTTAAPTTTTTAAPTTTTTAAPTTTTTAAPTTTTTAAPTTTTTAGSTTTTTAAPTTTTTAGSTTTTTAGPTTTTTAGPTTTTTAGSTTTTTAGSTTTTTAGSTTTTAVATTTTTTTTAPTTTTTLPPGTPALTLVKTADPSTFDMEGVTINYSYLVTSTGNAAVIGPITVSDSRMTVACPPVNSVGNNDDNLDVGESLICTSSLVTSQADVILGYIFTSSVAAGANASSDPVETNVPYATVGIPTLSEWSMMLLSFLFLMMGMMYLRTRQTV